jgi:putative Holliday junction resolvase
MPDGPAGAPAPVRAAPFVVVGLDFGLKRIGVAAGDSLTRGARPLGVVAARDGAPDWPALGRYVREWGPSVLVVGVPYNMDGTTGTLTAAAREFAAELARRFALEVATVDERLTSREAEDLLRHRRASGARTRRVRHGDVDAAAACVMVEQWLRALPRAPGAE